MAKEKMIHVVFEYIAGTHVGGRYWSSYPESEIARLKADHEKPDCNTKIVAIDVTRDEAIEMVNEVMLGGFAEKRMNDVLEDPNMPDFIKEMEAMKLLFAAEEAIKRRVGGRTRI